MIILWRRLAVCVAREIAANLETGAKAADIVQQAGQEAKRIFDSQSPDRTAGQKVRRAGE